jgi:hypothetical protein
MVHKTSVMREFPFPNLEKSEGYLYVPESIVWRKIATKYKSLYINETLRVYHIDERSDRLMKIGITRSSRGAVADHFDALTNYFDWASTAPFLFWRHAINFSRFSFHIKSGIASQWKSLRGRGPCTLWLLGLPIAMILARRDRHSALSR